MQDGPLKEGTVEAVAVEVETELAMCFPSLSCVPALQALECSLLCRQSSVWLRGVRTLGWPLT